MGRTANAEKPETRDLSWCQASQRGISGLRSALCVTSLGANLWTTGTDYWPQICSLTLKDLVNTDPDRGSLSSVFSPHWGGRSPGALSTVEATIHLMPCVSNKRRKENRAKGVNTWIIPPANSPSRFYIHKNNPTHGCGDLGKILINICKRPGF